MRLSQFITKSKDRIISDWEVFARSCRPAAIAMDLEQRRDHVAAMLDVIVRDLDTPQTKREQKEKSLGNDDASVHSSSAANSHGTDRATSGYTPEQMVGEFRALRASVLRRWSEAQTEFNRTNLEEVTRFNEAIDQLLVESITRYAHDVDRVKDLFLGVLGHDLRNPLGAIMMGATVMMTKEGPSGYHSGTAARMLSAGSRMDRLIGDLLDFTRSRLGAGIPIDTKRTDLEAVCRQTVDEIVAFHPKVHVTFKSSGDLQGKWDGPRIAQALSNLMGNAVQHGTRNSPIAVTLRGEPKQVSVSVHNEGVMIPKGNLQDIFNPFRQLDAGTAKGSPASIGLGLYIVQAIVTAHEGTIDVESTKEGTTFTMRLPRA